MFVSAASDIDPNNVAGQKTAEPAVVDENASKQTIRVPTEEQPTVVAAAETAEEAPAQTRTGGARQQGMMRLRGCLPRAVSWRRATEPRLPRLLKKEGPRLHPEQRLLCQRAPLAGIRVQ